MRSKQCGRQWQTAFQIALLSNNENEQTAAAHNNMDGSHDQTQKGL